MWNEIYTPPPLKESKLPQIIIKTPKYMDQPINNQSAKK